MKSYHVMTLSHLTWLSCDFKVVWSNIKCRGKICPEYIPRGIVLHTEAFSRQYHLQLFLAISLKTTMITSTKVRVPRKRAQAEKSRIIRGQRSLPLYLIVTLTIKLLFTKEVSTLGMTKILSVLSYTTNSKHTHTHVQGCYSLYATIRGS